MDENMWVLRGLGYVCAIGGKKTEALMLVDRMIELSQKRYVDPFSIAVIYAGLGEKDKLFEWLEKAYADRSNGLSSIVSEPQLDGIRTDPRYISLVKRMGLGK